MPRDDVFRRILSQDGRKAVILDGGFGTELERLGKDYTEDPLWSARILLEDPDAIKLVHRRYYNAGADVGTTCSYQATFKGFERDGKSSDEAEELLRRSVRLAAAARDEFWADHQARQENEEGSGTEEAKRKLRRPKPLVAFSSGPFATALADGSEYSGSYAGETTFEQLVDFHRRKLRAIDGEAYDVIAFETLPALKEARAIAHLLRTESFGRPAWLSFNCRDDCRLATGESFADEAVPLALETASIAAIGVNCVPPRNVPGLLRSAAKVLQPHEDRPLLLAYPNSGEGWSNATGEWDGDPELRGDLGRAGREWVDAGASLVGGCCRTTPEHIASLAASLT